MAFIEDVRKNKGDIKLTNMLPKVYNVFDLLGTPAPVRYHKGRARGHYEVFISQKVSDV